MSLGSNAGEVTAVTKPQEAPARLRSAEVLDERVRGRRDAMLKPFRPKAGGVGEHSVTTIGKAFGQNTLASAFGVRPQLAGNDEIVDPYLESVWVHACTRLRADSAAGIPWVVRESSKPDAKPIPEGHPIAKLYASPNAITTASQMADAHQVHMITCGEDFWFLADDEGKPVATDGTEITGTPTQIIQVSGEGVGDEIGKSGVIEKWFYTAVGSSQRQVFPRAAVLHFRTYDRSNPQRGVGPVQVALRILSLGFQHERYLEAGARAGGPGAFLVYEGLLAEIDRQQQELDAAMQDPNAATRLKILEGPQKWSVIPITTGPREMMALEMLDKVRDIVCTALETPLLMISDSTGATYENKAQAGRFFWTRLRAKLQAQADVINAHFFGRFRDPEIRRMRIAPDFSNVDALREDNSARYKSAREFADSTGVSVAESCELHSVPAPKDEAAKTAFFRAGTQTLDQVLNPPEPIALPAPDAPPPDAAKSALAPNPRFLVAIKPLEEPEQRREYARQYAVRALDPFERRVYAGVLGWRESFGRAMVRRLDDLAHGKAAPRGVTKSAADDSARIEAELLYDLERWMKLLDSATREPLTDAWKFGLVDAAQEINGIALPMSDPRVLAELTQQLIQLREGVTSRLAQQVKETLLDGLRESTTTGTLQERVLAELPALTEDLRLVFGSNEARALTIARTETGRASNGARFAQYRAEGVKEIQWITAHDDAVRESHQQLDGEVRSLGVEFKPRLRFPNDPDAPASETCNCRCVPLAIIPE